MAVDLLSLPVPLTTRRISEALAYAEKASEFEIIRVMSELNQNGYRLIVQRLGNWAAVHMRRPGGIRKAKDALTRYAVMGFDLDAMDLAFIKGQMRQN
jgi:hypothetical protein